MKILIISPSSDPGKRTPHEHMIPQLAMYILEGLTPSRHQVKTVEEEIEDVDLDEECDLVGISCMTANAPRAYYLSQEFRRRGKKVVLGGVHPTILPDEAIQFADSVVIGEAEGIWEELLSDFESGNLKKNYYHPNIPLDRYIPLKFRESTKKRLFNVVPVMSTRGCPYNCEFCCVSDLFGKQIRHVPVPNVVHNIQDSCGRIFIFLDDNIVGSPPYAKELFKAIKPLKIRWVGQSSISFVQDDELMKLAAESGCVGLFFGLESVSIEQLKSMRKSIKDIGQLEDAIRKVKDFGIHFHASIIFGFDNDTPAIFPETLEFLERNKIGSASINILTPYPGTKIYEKFKSEGRLLTMNWKYYDNNTVVFNPKKMTPYELQAGAIWTKKEFSKMSSILHRLPGNISHPSLYLALNFGVRKSNKTDPKRLKNIVTNIFDNISSVNEL